MWSNSDFSGNDELLMHIVDKPGVGYNSKVLITLQYTSLYRRPIREVHGGATPEEVLVPVIILSRQESVVQYDISVHSYKITRRSPFLWLSINPIPITNPILIEKDPGQIQLEFNSEDKKWKADLSTFKSGKYKTTIKIDDFEKDINIEISSGIKHEDDLI